jgi:hypothetical protein
VLEGGQDLGEQPLPVTAAGLGGRAISGRAISGQAISGQACGGQDAEGGRGDPWVGSGGGSSLTSVDTFRPMPTTTASPTASARIPPSLAGPASTSFGHFSRASTLAAARTAEATDTPASSGSQPRRAGGTVSGRTSRENVRAARGGDTQLRPIRPRPAVCSSAASTTPSGAPAAARASRSALVEPVEASTSTARHRPSGLTTARRRPSASRAARPGVSFSARIITHYCSGSRRWEILDRSRNQPAP